MAALLLAALVGPAGSAAPAPADTPAAAPAAPAPATPDRPVWGDLYPAFPGDIVARQPDGSSFKAKLTNAEIGANLEVDGGYTVTKRADGWWVYADGRDADGALVETPARVGLDPRPAELVPGVGRTPNVWGDSAGGDMRLQAFRQLQLVAAEAQAQAAQTGEPRVFRFPVLMLATWWDESKGQTGPQFQPGTDTPEYFKKLLDGFGGNPRGTLTEFYFENSFGQFVVQIDVFGPYTSQRSRQDRCYYGGIEPPEQPFDDLDPTDSVLGVGGGGAIGMALEAFPQADPTVDFSVYDNNDDGEIDFTGIIHSGPDMAATGDPCNTWSHAIDASLGNPGGIPTSDGVVAARLFTMPEIDLEIGVAVHEMAHALGEPDYYNTTYTSMGTGDWDVMAGGSWFGNPPGSNPTGFNPASRVSQGWMTPTIVDADRRGVALQPRELVPFPGYRGDQPNPNVLLVPTRWVKVGDVTVEPDGTEYEWTEDDVRGLVLDGDRGYVLEGYYVENWSRTVNAPPIRKDMTRAPYFDRQALSSGLMVWHWDYFARSNVSTGANNAQNDPNRPQMDPEEFDFNDNTQELQLGTTRGEASDLVWGAATGVTSGTRLNPPGVPAEPGEPQPTIEFSGVTPPAQSADHPFTVEEGFDNYIMVVTAVGAGDCTLQLFRVENGEERAIGGVVDSGFVQDAETINVVQPEPGDYIARVGDFAACGPHNGSVTFSPSDVYLSKGAADTWSNSTGEPTGWAFTNIGPGEFTDFDHSAEAPGPEAITLDVLNFGDGEIDVSPGFARGVVNDVNGRAPVNAGRANQMSVPVFNNGGESVEGIDVAVRLGSPTGPVVAQGTIAGLDPYSRTDFSFTFTPTAEGPFSLFTTVDAGGELAEVQEANNTQKADGWAGPAGPRVLVVDDDGSADSEVLYAGALRSLGIPYAIATEHVTAAEMAAYDAVIWEAGLERYQGQMDENDRAAVAEYLDGGGKLLYTSPRAAAALGEPPGRTNPLQSDESGPFLKNYFGVQYVDTQQVGGGEVTGLGDILGTDTFPTDVFPGRPLQDVFALAEWSGEEGDVAIGEATPVASWEKGGDDSLMGVRVDGDAGFKTVFLGFNLAQLVETDDAIEVLGDVMEHFGVEGGAAAAPTPGTGPIVYHPQVRNRVSNTDTPVKAVVLGAAAGDPVTLSYQRHGSGAWVTVPMSAGSEPGSYQATIPAKDVTPSGVDYYIRAGSTYDPAGADDRSLAHAIGVAIPEVPTATDDACPPDVPSGAYDDTGNSAHERNIDCVTWYTIALGKGGRRYDPGANVTREQMASFLARLALEGGVVLPTNAPDAFDDDNGSTHEPFINALAALGVIEGKGGRRYDPLAPVTREQMASLVARTHEEVVGSLPAISRDWFGDDDRSVHQAAINALAELGVVVGKGDLNGDGKDDFDPGGTVSREQMASFLARELGVLVAAGKAFIGGARVSIAQPRAAAGSTVAGVLATNKDLRSLAAEGCGISEDAVAVDAEGRFTLTVPADQDPGACAIRFTAVTRRPGAAAGEPDQRAQQEIGLTVTAAS